MSNAAVAGIAVILLSPIIIPMAVLYFCGVAAVKIVEDFRLRI